MEYERTSQEEVKIIQVKSKERVVTNEELASIKSGLQKELEERRIAFENSKAEIEAEIAAIESL